MGRPRELTGAEREQLLADGYKPVIAEVWVADWDNPAFVARIEEECRQIRESDKRTAMNETLDAFLRDVWNDLE